MANVIGAVRLIKYRKRSGPGKATGAYKRRNESLPWIGYASYQEYLRSDDWAVIRKRVLARNPECRCCGRPASQVHHWDYEADVLLGLRDNLLLSVCEPCHEGIEFDGTDKRPLDQVQKVLLARLPGNAQRQIANALAKRKTRRSGRRQRKDAKATPDSIRHDQPIPPLASHPDRTSCDHIKYECRTYHVQAKTLLRLISSPREHARKDARFRHATNIHVLRHLKPCTDRAVLAWPNEIILVLPNGQYARIARRAVRKGHPN